MEEKRLLDGICLVEGLVLPSTPLNGREETRRTSSHRKDGHLQGMVATDCSGRPVCEVALATAHKLPSSVDEPLTTSAGLTIAFLLQVQSTLPNSMTAAVLNPHQPKSFTESRSLTHRQVLKLPQAIHDELPLTSTEAVTPHALRKVLLMLTFNSPASTMTALAKLHAAALASQGRTALVALQPVPLVSRIFADAVAADDTSSSERAAVVLLTLLAKAQLPLPDDVAGSLVIPSALRLLGGTAAAAAQVNAATAAAAAAAVASGALSSSSLLLHLHPQHHPQPSAVTHLPQLNQPHAPSATASAPPWTCRLAAARLLLHLVTVGPLPPDHNQYGSTGAPVGRRGHTRPPGQPSASPAAFRDRLVAAGGLEACVEALAASVMVCPELQLTALQILAALTADATGWPWNWPVVRAAAVEGCARYAVALMQLFDGGGTGVWAELEGELEGEDGAADSEAAAQAAARDIVVHLARGPLLVRQALVRAGVLAPVVQAIMFWPPPAQLPQTQSSPVAAAARRHFSLCLGVLLQLSSLPGVRILLASPGLGPLLGHLLDLLEQAGAAASITGSVRRGSTGPGAASVAGTGSSRPSGSAAFAVGSDGGHSEVRGPLLELLLNLALDPSCHGGLAALGVERMLVRCIAAGQQLRLGPELSSGSGKRPGSEGAGGGQQQPWRSAAALRLLAALAADTRFSMPQTAMQRALAGVGGLEVVAEEVRHAAEGLPVPPPSSRTTHPSTAAYELGLTALCALLTGNSELQRRVAGMAELLTALAAALAAPAVMRSDERLRLTLTAWRLITAPLAAPDADPATARQLLISLGYNADLLPDPAGGGGASCLYDPAQEISSARSRDHRHSILLAAAEMFTGHRSSSASGMGGTSGPVSFDTGGAAIAGTGRAMQLYRRQASSDQDGRLDVAAAAGAGDGARDRGAGGVSCPVWSGPLLPGMPLPPPGAPPPNVAPLRLPSCISAASATAAVLAVDGRPGSRQAGGDRAASGTGFRRPASRDAQALSHSLSGNPSLLAASNGAQQAAPAPPHQSVFVSADSDEEGNELGGTAASCRAGSGRIMSARLTASPLSPPPGAIHAAAAAAACKAGASEPAPLPGSLLMPNRAQEGATETNSRSDSRAGGAPVEDTPFATATFDDPDTLRHPSTTIATLRASYINSCSANAGPRSRPLSSFGAAPGGSSGSGPSSPSWLQRRQGASVGAAAAVSIATGELPPPLLCLVSHLQALLQRPGAGSGAALVLVQLARLEVVRRSAVVVAGWGVLMEAVTCSLTGGAAEEQLAGPFHPPTPGPAGRGPPSTDPRDQLALLEAMAVAAGSAPDGRAALTAGRVVTALTELACGVGSLASSLMPSRQALGPTALHHMQHTAHSHPHSSRHSHRHFIRNRGMSGGLMDTQDLAGASAGPGGRVPPQGHGEGQGLLLRARTLASSILADLMAQYQVWGRMEEGRVGAVLAEQQLAALTEAAEAAGGPLLDSATAATLAAAAAGGSHMATGEQHRQRNAAARLLRQLAEHVDCARSYLARPVVVAGLLELLAEMWNTHGPSLAPATSASVLPRLTTATSAPMNLSRPQLPEPLTTATSRTITNNNVSALTLNPTPPQPSTFVMDTSFLNSHPSLAPFLPTPTPATATTTRSGSPATAPRPQMPSPSPIGSLALENGAVRRSITAGIVSFSGSGHGGPGGAGGGVQQLHSPMVRLGGGGVGGRPADSPHGVATRMSLHAAACSDSTSWTTHAQQAMKALEMAEERLLSPAPSNPFMRLHAHTHAGFTIPAREPLAGSTGPPSATVGHHSRGSTGQGTDAAAVEAPDSPEDSFTEHLRQVAPPPAPTAPKPSQPSPSAVSAAPAPAGGRLLLGTGIGAARQPLPLSRLASRSLRAVEEEGGAAEGPGSYESGVASPREHRPDALRGIPMFKRGTRTLVSGVSAGGCGPGLGPRAASAASAAACARELTDLLSLLAEADSDAARTMCTMPAVELFVDLLGASCVPLVLASLGLLRMLARRQDAHETFWDCDAVAQLVAHLQLRSPAAVAAMTGGGTGGGSGVGGGAAGGSVLLAALSGFIGGAGGGGEVNELLGEEEGAGGPAAALQLAAAQVLERLCGDPDLHSRLAATELPAALMAVVRRAAEPAARPSQTGNIPPQGPGDPRPPPGPLLSCALAALGSLLECAEVRRQARERRFPLHLGVLAGSGGYGDRQVSLLAARCGERLREDGRGPVPTFGARLGSRQLPG